MTRHKQKRAKKPDPAGPKSSRWTYLVCMIGVLCLGLFATIQPLISSAALGEIVGGNWRYGGKTGIQTLLLGITFLAMFAYLVRGYKQK